MIELIGSVAAVLTTFAFLPQAIKTWQTKKTKDLSLPMYLSATVGVLLWFIYGVAIHSTPLIAANAVTFVFSSCILFLKIKHG